MPYKPRIKLTLEHVKSLLGDRETIHTFKNPGGMLIGADWSRESVLEACETANFIEVGGESCRGMGHGLLIATTDMQSGVVFVEVDNKELQALEDTLSKSLPYKKVQDESSHWYWIPEAILEDYEKDSRILEEQDYPADLCSEFDENYGIYRTGGHPDNTPSFYQVESVPGKK